MRKKAMALLLSLTMASSMLLTGCGGSTESDKIKIAFAGPLTGDMSVDGIDARNGCELAIKKINEDGGINGKTVELVEYDDKGDTKEAATVASRICQDSDIYATIGHYNSGCTLAAAPIYEKGQMTTVSYASSANAVSDAGDYIFRSCNSDDVAAGKCAEVAVKLGYQNLAVIYENDDYGVGLAESFTKYAEESGAEIVSSNAYLLGETKDFTSILTKIRESGAEMIFIAGLYAEAAMIMKQEAQVGMDIPCIGSEALYSDGIIELGGDAVEGLYTTAGFSTDSTEDYIQEFIADYNEEYGQNPGTCAACAYDGVTAIAEAMKNAEELTRENIKNEMYEIEDLAGVSGKITFDENGDVHKDCLTITIKDGKFTLAD